jgi:hypothetical protein
MEKFKPVDSQADQSLEKQQQPRAYLRSLFGIYWLGVLAFNLADKTPFPAFQQCVELTDGVPVFVFEKGARRLP